MREGGESGVNIEASLQTSKNVELSKTACVHNVYHVQQIEHQEDVDAKVPVRQPKATFVSF